MNRAMFDEDEPTTGERPGERPGENETTESHRNEGESHPCLINKEHFPDAKPGDTLTIKVLQVHGEELECEPVSKGEEDGDEPESELAPSGSRYDSMMD
jgi:hypothetical protein